MSPEEALEQIRRHHGLDIELGDRCPGGEVGAYFARLNRSAQVVFKWSTQESRAAAWDAVVHRVAVLRSIGYPAPHYYAPLRFPGGVVLMQDAVSGSWSDHVDGSLVERLLLLTERQQGMAQATDWTDLMQMSLVEGCDGWCLHEPLRRYSPESRRLLGRITAVGRNVPPLPTGDVVHLDFHHRNVLRDGDEITAVVDWEGCTDGDRWFDLVTLAFGLLNARTNQSVRARVWAHLGAHVPRDHLMVYVAHMALRLSDWRIRHHSAEEADEAVSFGGRQLDMFT